MTNKFSAYGFNHPLKAELEHMLSIAADLRRTTTALRFVASPSPLMREAGILGMALYTQALVSYVRCFSSGRRKGLNQDIFAKKPELLAAHTDIKTIRDKHVAHPVSEHEHCNVLVAAENPDAPAVGLGVRYWFLAGGDEKHIKLFLKVAEFASKHVQREITAKGNELAKLVIGPRATWKNAQASFNRCLSDEQVYGPIRLEA
jgi:hypothetical protein